MTTSGVRKGRLEGPTPPEAIARRQLAETDWRYLDRHERQLAQRYPHQWVAVHNGEIVLTGKDIKEFGRQLREQGWVERGVVVRYLDPDEGVVMISHPL
jgi:hypothetical protein